MPRRPFLLCALLAAVLAGCAPPGQGSPRSASPATTTAAPVGRDPLSGLRWIDRRNLPPQAGPVLKLIAQGGPFRSARDGVTFANREGVLPRQPRGTYREYTVPTPGSSDRGTRRIVCAGPPRSAAGCYYTADHYASFRRITP